MDKGQEKDRLTHCEHLHDSFIYDRIITLSDVIKGVLSHHAPDNLGHLRHFGNIIALNDKGDHCDVLQSAY